MAIRGRVKVLLADDHELFREGLCRMLELEKGIDVVGEAKDGSEVIAKVEELLPDVVLMDIIMPGVDGIGATRQIKEAHPGVEVIMLTVYEDDEHLFEAIKAGARGYLLKDSSIANVVEAVKAASRGESLLDSTLARKVLDNVSIHKEIQETREVLFRSLTEREMEILRSLASAKTTGQIAKALSISEKTVKNHITSIYRKLKVNTRTEAVLKAIKLELIDLNE